MTLALEYPRIQIIQALTIFSSVTPHNLLIAHQHTHQKESIGKTVKLKAANNPCKSIIIAANIYEKLSMWQTHRCDQKNMMNV